jgi:hypothetical protein
MCFHGIKWFDGVEDCIDASDEELQEGEDCPGYQCKDHICIPSMWLNDAIPDCRNAEDEEDFMLQKAIGNMEWSCEAPDSLPYKGSVRKCFPKQQHCIYNTDSHGNMP